MSIENSEKSADLQVRIQKLNAHFTESIYRNVCRSLLERHKLLFSFILCIQLEKGRGEVDDNIWRFLLTGGVGLDNPYPNPAADWLNDKSWAEIVRASEMPTFRDLMAHVKENKDKWKQLYDSTTPHEHPYPDDYNKRSALERYASNHSRSAAAGSMPCISDLCSCVSSVRTRWCRQCSSTSSSKWDSSSSNRRRSICPARTGTRHRRHR